MVIFLVALISISFLISFSVLRYNSFFYSIFISNISGFFSCYVLACVTYVVLAQERIQILIKL